MGSSKSSPARAQYQAVDHQHKTFATLLKTEATHRNFAVHISSKQKGNCQVKKSHFLFSHSARHSENEPYLYVTCTAVPGSSLSQIKATLSGDFSTCWSKQFTVKKKTTQRFTQSLIIRKVLCKPSLDKCNSKQVQDETSVFGLLGTHSITEELKAFTAPVKLCNKFYTSLAQWP